MNDNEKKIPDNTSDEFAEKQLTSDENNANTGTTAEEAANAAKESGARKDQTDAEINDAAGQSLDNNGSDTGIKTHDQKPRIGKTKVISAANGEVFVDGMSNIGQEEYKSSSDIDKYDANQLRQAAQYINIASDIDVEAIRALDVNPDSVIDDVNEASIQVLKSDSIEKIFTHADAMEPLNSPNHRRYGTLFMSGQTVINPTGDIIEGIHDVKKQFGTDDVSKPGHYCSSLYLNKITPDKRIIPNKFVSPKRGKYLLVGWNPYVATKNAVDGSNLDEIINNQNRFNSESGVVVENCSVYQSKLDNKNRLFKVIDVSVIADNCQNATQEALELLTCAKSKMKLGVFEALSANLAKINDTLGEGDFTIEKWPEFHKDRDRCSLWNGNTVGMYANKLDNVTACNNHPVRVFEFIESLKASDAMVFTLSGLSTLNDTKSIKFMKGQTGKQEADEWFHSWSGWSTRQKAIGSYGNHSSKLRFPNMAPFLRGIGMSGNSIRRAGSLVYVAKELKALCKDFNEILLQNESIKNLMEKIGVIQECIDQLSIACDWGTVRNNDEMTSNAIVKLPDQIDLILDYDPNDLIQHVGSGSQTKWYPAVGYANIEKDTLRGSNSRNTVYYLCPAWLDVFCQFLNMTESSYMFTRDMTAKETSLYDAFTDVINNVLTKNNDSDKDANSDNLLAWLLHNAVKDGNDFKYTNVNQIRYLPIYFNSFNGSLFGYVFAQACSLAMGIVFDKHSRTNAYLTRWVPSLMDWGFKDILNEYYDVDAYSMIKNLLNNDALKLDADKQKPSLMPQLFDSAREDLLSKDNNILAYFETRYFGKGLFDADAKTISIALQPSKFMQNIVNLKDITLFTQPNEDMKEHPFSSTLDSISATIGGVSTNITKDEATTPDLVNKFFKTQSAHLNDSLITNNYTKLTLNKDLYAKIGNIGKDIEHTIRDWTINLKVTNYDVDQEYYHAYDDPSNELFGRDWFLIPNSDYMIAGYDSPMFVDSDLSLGLDEHFANNMLIPIDEVYGVNQNESQPTTIVGTRKGWSTVTEAHTYYDWKTDDDITKSAITNNPCDTMYPDKAHGNIYYQNVGYRKLCRPSLYGFKREVCYGATLLSADMTTRMMEKTDLANSSGHKAKMMKYAFLEFGLLPSILGRTLNESTKNWDAAALTDETLSYDVSRAEYYIKQKLFVSDYYDEYIKSGEITEGYKIEKFFELGNWVIPHDTLSMINSTQRNIAALMMDKTNAVAVQDEQDTLLNYYKKSVLAHCYLKDFTSDAIHMDTDWVYDDKYTSQKVFNDTRKYIIGRPISRLQTKWRNLNNYINAFVKQYSK